MPQQYIHNSSYGSRLGYENGTNVLTIAHVFIIFEEDLCSMVGPWGGKDTNKTENGLWNQKMGTL